MSKTKCYDLIPNELKNKYWSCFNPVIKENTAEPCGSCGVCLQHTECNITHPKIKLFENHLIKEMLDINQRYLYFNKRLKNYTN